MSDSWTQTVVASVAKWVHAIGGPLGLNRKMDTNSLACLEYVKQHAERGNPSSIVAAIDSFAAKHMMMNVGDRKGAIVDDEIRAKKPKVMVELGAYTGYSAVRFANIQREVSGAHSHYYSFEYSPVFAARVREMVEFAGLSDQVTVIEGSFADQFEAALKDKHVDIYFIDHDKSLYRTDAERIVSSGTLKPGSLLIADNVLFPGAPDYLQYLEESSHFTSTLHRVEMDMASIVDAVSIATYRG